MCNLLKKLFQKIRKGPPKLARFAISRKVWQHWSLVDSLRIRWLLSDQLKTVFLRKSACADCFVNAGDFSILWTRELEKNQIDGVCAERQNIISTWTVEHKISFWKITFLTWLIAAFFNGIYFRSHNEPADQIFCTLKKNQSRWTGVPQTRALSSSKIFFLTSLPPRPSARKNQLNHKVVEMITYCSSALNRKNICPPPSSTPYLSSDEANQGCMIGTSQFKGREKGITSGKKDSLANL